MQVNQFYFGRIKFLKIVRVCGILFIYLFICLFIYRLVNFLMANLMQDAIHVIYYLAIITLLNNYVHVLFLSSRALHIYIVSLNYGPTY
jgi:hypothetical protein